ncbi:hypothetical protein Anas_02712, partial [Armadillidium nasatum]
MIIEGAFPSETPVLFVSRNKNDWFLGEPETEFEVKDNKRIKQNEINYDHLLINVRRATGKGESPVSLCSKSNLFTLSETKGSQLRSQGNADNYFDVINSKSFPSFRKLIDFPQVDVNVIPFHVDKICVHEIYLSEILKEETMDDEIVLSKTEAPNNFATYSYSDFINLKFSFENLLSNRFENALLSNRRDENTSHSNRLRELTLKSKSLSMIGKKFYSTNSYLSSVSDLNTKTLKSYTSLPTLMLQIENRKSFPNTNLSYDNFHQEKAFSTYSMSCNSFPLKNKNNRTNNDKNNKPNAEYKASQEENIDKNDVTPKNNFENQISFLREENERLQEKNSLLLKEVDELRYLKEAILKSEIQPTYGEEKGVDLKERKLDPNVSHLALELTHAKEALSALKADRKRLKAEKFDLLNQMKQLYATLEDKERELREFIRTYEQRMKDSDESLRQMASERDESEREKWNLLKHARDEAERAVALATQLGKKDVAVKRLEEELEA